MNNALLLWIIAGIDLPKITVQLAVGALSLTSVWLAPTHRIAPWPILIGGHALFLAYAAVTGQWGFWLLNAGMILAGSRNWLRATKIRHAV